MKDYEIKEGDIVEIDYIDEFTKERINEGEALVLWRGFNHQPLVHFPPSNVHRGITIWTSYNRIARVVGHVDIERYMEDAIAQEHEPYVPKEPKVDFDELKRKILSEVDGGTDDMWLRYGDVCDRISDSIDEYAGECREKEDKAEQER